MEHIRIHLLLNHYNKKLGLSDRSIALALTDKLGKEVTIEDINMFRMSNQPQKKSLAQALKLEGYKPKDIAEMISATIYDTRYYLSNPNKKPYVNNYWNTNVSQDPYFSNEQNRSTYSPPTLEWNTKSE